MFVKPAEGLRVLDPISKQPLPAAGREVPEASYWFRRLRSGDVVSASAPVVQIGQIPDSAKPAPKGKE